jgi:hypothetical protein
MRSERGRIAIEFFCVTCKGGNIFSYAQRSIATPEAGQNGAIKPADSARTPAKSTDSVTNSIELQH